MRNSEHEIMCIYVLQAGDLYEKIGKVNEALQCYRKGAAYRRGNFNYCTHNINIFAIKTNI